MYIEVRRALTFVNKGREIDSDWEWTNLNLHSQLKCPRNIFIHLFSLSLTKSHFKTPPHHCSRNGYPPGSKGPSACSGIVNQGSLPGWALPPTSPFRDTTNDREKSCLQAASASSPTKALNPRNPMARLTSWEEKRENLSQSSHSELGVVQVTQRGEVRFPRTTSVDECPRGSFSSSTYHQM